MSHKRLTLLLTGGTLHDGSESQPRKADIGILNDRIVFVGSADSAIEAGERIDISGLHIAPGFIDTHAHSEFSLVADGRAEAKLLQGITTEINGNCGLSAAPIAGAAVKQREPDFLSYGIKKRWRTFPEYYSALTEVGIAINTATLVGHGNVRASVMGYEDRAPRPDEMEAMKSLVRDAVAHGTIGLSTGLIYPPGVYASTREITELARAGVEASAGRRFIYASHMRSEGDRLTESIAEAIAIGRASGAHVHISHLKTAGKRNWHKAGDAIALMDGARSEGISLTCDRYPYAAAATDLDAVLPAWTYEGGRDAEVARLKDPSTLARIRAEVESDRPDGWDAVVISDVDTQDNKDLEGLDVTRAAKLRGISPFDLVVRVLIEEDLRAGAVFHSMSEDNMKRFLSLPYVMIGTDSTARSYSGVTRKGKPHPRGFGSMPRFLSKVAPELSLSGDPVARITGLPASTFSLVGRGLVREGYYADLAVYDSAALADRAAYDDPWRRPDGIVHVIVNGRVAVRSGEFTGARAGIALGYSVK